MPPPYVIDSSIWIRMWRHHPPDIFKNLWQQLNASIAAGHVRSPEEVLHELEQGTDALAETLKQRGDLFEPLDAPLMAAVGQIVAQCQGFADEDGERHRADPFVVALGQLRNGTVVTGERPRKDPHGRPRIPDACGQFGITWLDWFGFLRAIGWQL